jgi:hypothetical protein
MRLVKLEKLYVTKPKYTKYDAKYLSFEFTTIYAEERPQYILCMKILSADRTKEPF